MALLVHETRALPRNQPSIRCFKHANALYSLKMRRRYTHVFILQFYFRKKLVHIVMNTNLRWLHVVARKKYRFTCAHAMRANRQYGIESKAVLHRNIAAHVALSTAVVDAYIHVCLRTETTVYQFSGRFVAPETCSPNNVFNFNGRNYTLATTLLKCSQIR